VDHNTSARTAQRERARHVQIVLMACALALAYPGSRAALSAPPAPPTDEMQRIIERARAHQDSAKSFYFAWTATTTVEKGSARWPVNPGVSPPAEDTEVTNAYTLLVGGGKVRFSQKGLAWHSSEGEFVPFEQQGLFSEGVQRNLIVSGGYAVIRSRTEILGNPKYGPPFLAYRLLDPVMGPAGSDQLSVVGQAEREGHPCLVAEATRTYPGGNQTYRWWFAQDMDLFVIRAEFVWPDSGSELVTDLEYEPGAEVGWRLSSWTRAGFTPPVSSTVTEAWFNREVPEDAFDLVFPAGTRVHDTLRGVDYVVGAEGEKSGVAEPAPGKTMEQFPQQVERQTGAERPAKPAQPARPVPKPDRTQQASPPPTARGGIPAWAYASALVAIILLAALILLRRARRA
jgi:hypothetical protein